jgi:hypothetical protein
MIYRFRSLIRYTSLFLLLLIIHYGCRASSVSEFRHSYSYTLVCPNASAVETEPCHRIGSQTLRFPAIKYKSTSNRIKKERTRRKISEITCGITPFFSESHFPFISAHVWVSENNPPLQSDLSLNIIRGPPLHS